MEEEVSKLQNCLLEKDEQLRVSSSTSEQVAPTTLSFCFLSSITSAHFSNRGLWFGGFRNVI